MKWIALALLGFICIGCASTTASKHQTVTLSDRLDRLEKRFDEQDSDLERIKADLSHVSTKMPERSYESFDRPELDTKTELSVKDIQTALKKTGFYQGKIDGVAGAKTDKAIKDFQKSKGLNMDGKVGRETTRFLQKYLD
jgi:murein L,D-transpeptidase YcbB/YkuD